MNSQNIKYLLTVLVLISSFGAQAVPFTQTQSVLEADANEDGITDPLIFTYSGLPTFTGSSFDLDLSFAGFDLGETNELLIGTLHSGGNIFELGEYPITFTNNDTREAAGNGILRVLFADVGGFLNDPFSVILTPTDGVNSFGVSGSGVLGSADLTFSATVDNVVSVFEPATLSIFGLGLFVMALARRKQV